MKRIQVGTCGFWSKKESVEVVFHQFSGLAHAPGDCVTSSDFSCHGLEWGLELYPGGEERADEQHDKENPSLAVFLILKSNPKMGEECVAKVSFETPELDYKSDVIMSAFLKDEDCGYGLPEWISRECFLEECHDDTLTIIVSIQILIPQPKTWIPGHTLQRDMFRLMQKDVTLPSLTFYVGKDENRERIRASNAILLVRAPAIKDIIDGMNSKKEVACINAESGSISLPDILPKHFRSMLTFIYTDEITFLNDEPDLEGLLITANRFGCWKLKLFIEAKLIEDDLNSGSSIELLLFADANNCSMLKEAALALLAQCSLAAHPDFGKIVGSVSLLKEIHQMSCGKSFDGDDNVADQYSKMSIVELYETLEKEGVELESDGSRLMLMKRLRSSQNWR